MEHKQEENSNEFTENRRAANKEAVNRYRISHPWARPREYARRRCVDPKHREYKGYGGRGIKFMLTMEDAKRLFERDNARSLKKPSLDRIDPDGHYSFENCRFIEFLDNITRHRQRISEPLIITGTIQWEE